MPPERNVPETSRALAAETIRTPQPARQIATTASNTHRAYGIVVRSPAMHRRSRASNGWKTAEQTLVCPASQNREYGIVRLHDMRKFGAAMPSGSKGTSVPREYQK